MRTYLITGGTGSLGTAVAELLLTQDIDALRIFSRDEHKQEQFARSHTDPRIRMLLGDVRDADRLHRAFDGVDVVIHCAALKRAPAIEYNALEAVHTNIMGTENVINAAIDRMVGRVVLISSDKAVRPTNTYGATKMIAEQLMLHPYTGMRGPVFSVVRLGNLVGSRGSLVPLVLEQRHTGTLTLTHPDMTRYWMTLPDAAAFVLDVLRKPAGLYTPRLPSVRITDVFAALAPECAVQIIGMRPGERLYESLSDTDTSDTNDWWLTREQIAEAAGLRGGAHV